MPVRDVDRAEDAVLAVIAGTPVEEAARRAGVATPVLAEDLERYRAAGRAALELRARGWFQTGIHFADYPSAAQTFTAYVLPALRTGPVGAWWFVRKHPRWRLRACPVAGASLGDVTTHIAEALDHSMSWGVVTDWRPGLYEPETVAFGGPVGMTLAHELFHSDSVGVLDLLRRAADGCHKLLDAKSTSLLAMTVLMRAARLEFGEQGDVWARVEERRPLPDDLSLEGVRTMIEPLLRLLLTDIGPLMTDAPLAPVRPWLEGLERCGRTLADAASEGTLALGIRGVLARHVLFHWNRMGFTTRQQAIWARAAREAILGS
jgi:thiopeptide-type bacteriocin biosynthesis protein